MSKAPIIVQGQRTDIPGVTVLTPPPQDAPPPPPSGVPSENAWGNLPPGWVTAVSPTDGRIYYWEQATGRTSWTHPLAMNSSKSMDNQSPPPDNRYPTPGERSNNSWNSPWRGFSWERRNRGIGMEDSGMTRTEYLDTPFNASRRPENHQCYAVTALILCFPLGVCACIHSFSVDRAWRQGRYGDAVNHSRQATSYACFGCFVGACFWIYWIIWGERRIEWPKWDFNFD